MVVTVAAFVVLVGFWLAMHHESRRHYGIWWGWIGRSPSREHMFVKLVLEPQARLVSQRMNEMLPEMADLNKAFKNAQVVFDESPLLEALEEMEQALEEEHVD